MRELISYQAVSKNNFVIYKIVEFHAITEPELESHALVTDSISTVIIENCI